ncbi:MAG: hypothetical protein WD009_10125 [Phycisphaeraceae bacterium]
MPHQPATTIALAVALLLLVGCTQNMPLERAQPLRGPGLPHNEYLVHGSVEELAYTAEEAGVVYLVEGRTQTPMGQRRLNAGQRYEIEFDEATIALIAERVGVAREDVSPFLYFVPDSARPARQEADESR